jgi:glutamine synthetase
MTTQKLIAEVERYAGKKVKLAITDMDGILRGKVISLDKFSSAVEGGSGFCDVIFGWDSADVCYENDIKFTGWHSGYPDANMEVDLATYRTVPWDNDIPMFLGDFKNKDGSPLEICPRAVLKKVKEQAKELGFDATFAEEFEWFNFDETSENLHDKSFRDLKPLTKGMFGYSILRTSQNKEFFNDLFDLCTKFRIPVEGIHTETGPGVYEVAITYCDILEAADRAVLFKTAVKEIAHLHGVIPTFMAKWSDDYPGCGGHIHQSLWKDGKNAFYDKEGDRGMSETMKSYIAGQLHCLPHILPMYAPNTNSFKRLVEGAWAPTTLTWAVDNRTVAIRALPGSDKSTRIEMRVPGSDVNPYLAMAASLASGLYGIKNNLKLDTAETIGNGYKNLSNGVLPSSLKEATNLMKESTVAKEIFSEEFIDHFTKTREWEWKQAAKAVTDYELKRHFELT